jgi:DNA gyrase subunit B
MSRYSADQIIELEFLEAVRMRPGMYIGNNNVHGLHHILLEVLDNSVDECTSGNANQITVTIEKDGAVTIEDDGRGMPIDWKPDSKMSALTQVHVKPHAGGKFGGDDSAYSSSGGLHGIGLKCTNAFSDYLIVEVHRHGLKFRQRFENGGVPASEVEIYDINDQKVGEILSGTEINVPKRGLATGITINGKRKNVEADPKLGTGTITRFRPNRAWFTKDMTWTLPEKHVPWNFDRLDSRFRQIAHLYPGVVIEFHDFQSKPERHETYKSKNGLIDYILYLNEGEKPLHKPVAFKETIEVDVEGVMSKIQTEIAFQYAGEETQIYSFVNAIPTPLGGTHVSAFKASLTKAVKQFASNKKLLKKNQDFRGDDALLGLSAIIKLTMTNTPQFLSQTKESLTSPEVHGPVFSTTYNNLLDYLEKNSNTGKIIVNQALAAARGRDAAAQARKLMITRSAMDAGEYVLGKLADIQRRGGKPVVPIDHTAIYFVEGDSAGGSCKQARDSRYHAILPLRGKIPNVEKMKLNDILKNREIAAVVASIGAGVGRDCDVNLMRYGRAVVLVDADIDGSHIATLLATLFWRTMRPIIDEGRFFIARPPLYLVRNKRSKSTEYAYTEEDREAITKRWGVQNVTLQRYKGLGEMNPEQLRETVFKLPEGVAKNAKRQSIDTSAKNLAFFAQQDIRMYVDDVHRTRLLIEKLMGSNVAPRKAWLMATNWNEED